MAAGHSGHPQNRPVLLFLGRLAKEKNLDALLDVAAAVPGATLLVAGEGALNPDGTVADLARAESRAVTLGASSEDYVQITSGLKEGDVVLVPVQSTAGLGGAAAAVSGG